eukprot:gene16902-biopygen18833
MQTIGPALCCDLVGSALLGFRCFSFRNDPGSSVLGLAMGRVYMSRAARIQVHHHHHIRRIGTLELPVTPRMANRDQANPSMGGLSTTNLCIWITQPPSHFPRAHAPLAAVLLAAPALHPGLLGLCRPAARESGVDSDSRTSQILRIPGQVVFCRG